MTSAYKRKLHRLQRELRTLVGHAARERRRVVMLLEGWDGSGKSGAIRRMVRRLDPATYRVVSVKAPTREELRHHFLWRFRRALRARRTLTIFDRSWYGRVLFERVEGLVTRAAVLQAYGEIGTFETELAGPRGALVKVWLEIDAAEQRARLLQRARNPSKRYKLTADDWRNLRRRRAYERARDEMLARTDLPRTPWAVIDAADKRRARLTTLGQLVAALRRLEARPSRAGAWCAARVA